MTAELPLLGTGDGPLGHAVAVVFMVLLPLFMYLDAPCPDRPLDAAQRTWSRLTGRNKDH